MPQWENPTRSFEGAVLDASLNPELKKFQLSLFMDVDFQLPFYEPFKLIKVLCLCAMRSLHCPSDFVAWGLLRRRRFENCKMSRRV